MASFVICWVPTLINNTLVRGKQGQKIYFVPQFIASVATPLQGLFIMIVYEWAKKIRLREPPVNPNAGGGSNSNIGLQNNDTATSSNSGKGGEETQKNDKSDLEKDEVMEA